MAYNVIGAEHAGVYLVVDEQGFVVAVRKDLTEARTRAAEGDEYGKAA